MAALGGLVYFLQAWIFAHTQQSILDEGAYLVKGLLFATRQYRPFQFHGPWTNHMPLSYLIPGYAQTLFGPGLRTGRYLAVALASLFLIGLWLVSRRLGNPWLASGAVWSFALNPAVIKMYSVVASQGLVACMLVWVLVLILGENRPSWQILLGAAIAGLIPLTRINMAPVLPFVLGYIFWEHGKRMGVWASVLGLAAFGGGHALYWPNILTLWVKWLPSGLTPFLDVWRPDLGTNSWAPQIDLLNRVWSFWEGTRFHFIPLLGILITLILWPSSSGWRTKSQFKIAVFILSLFGILWGMHAWASLTKNYCVFCYSVYLSFFSFFGVILMVVSFPSWRHEISKFRAILAVVLILGLSAGVGFSQYLDFSGSLFSDQFIRRFIRTEIPRFEGVRIQEGSIALQGFLENYYGWDYKEIQLNVRRFLTTFVFSLAGLSVGASILVAARWLSRSTLTRIGVRGMLSTLRKGETEGGTALILLLMSGFILSPTAILGGGRHTYDCDSDVIRSYEAAGAHLAEQIPPGSLIYWRGGLSTVPLLYLEDFELFPPQLNNDYSFRIGGDPDTLVKYGFWNDELARKWVEASDVVLVEDRYYQGWLADEIESKQFDQSEPTPPTASCRSDSEIHIFWSKP